MNHIARNPIVVLLATLLAKVRNSILFVLLLTASYSFADNTFVVPDFTEYNRGINLGSEISRDVKYKAQSTDKLTVGVISPLMNNWESHSTMTTSLFPIMPSVKKNVVFYMKSFGRAQQYSVLWVSIRYFDKHGVFVDSTGGDTFGVPNQWKEISIPLISAKHESVYAEVWFVKFEDADKTGETIHPIYISSIDIK